eukprot:11087497-Alexandrium_andersonii.AAC.1
MPSWVEKIRTRGVCDRQGSEKACREAAAAGIAVGGRCLWRIQRWPVRYEEVGSVITVRGT